MQAFGSARDSSIARICKPSLVTLWPFALLILILATIASPARAQYSASLQGTVSDAKGALVPSAHVVLTEKDTGRKAETEADGAGNFFFGGLGPSLYTIEVSRDGFKTQVIDNFKVIADQANGIDVVLEVGVASTTVTVNADTQPLIDTETGNMGATISSEEVGKLPSFGRDVMQLAQLAPGMFGDGSRSQGGNTATLPASQDGAPGGNSGIFATENVPQASANGGRTDTNAITLDGVTITSVTWGGAAIITPNEDTLKEVQVVTNPYDAEYGRTSGVDIKLTSQNGTNVIHGSAFFKLDRPGLNAAPRWDPNGNPLGDKDTYDFNQLGGTVGGPIIHNRLFGFFGYEAIRNSGTTYPGGWYETSGFDGASSSSSIANKFLTLKGASPVYKQILEGANSGHDCASISLSSTYCNFIQGQGLDLGSPMKSATLGTQDPTWGGTEYTPGVGGGLDGTADMMYVVGINPSTDNEAQYSGRADYQATSKDLIAGTMYYAPVHSSDYNGAERGYNIFYHNALNYSVGALYDHTFNDHIINQARADMAGWRWNELKDNPQSPLGLPDACICNFSFGTDEGSMNNQNGFGNLFGPSLGSEFDQWTLNFKDVATWAHKTHNIKFGGNVTRLAYLDLPDWQAQPTYDFNNIWDFLNDAPYTESTTFDPRSGIPTAFRKDDRQMVYGFFTQDDWKIRPNLTLNLGVRWEYFPGMTEKHGTLPNLRIGSGSSLLTSMFIQLNSAEVNPQKGNFGPQIGFAWTPSQQNNRLVIHGGFGLAYNGLEMAVFTNNRFNSPFAYNSPNLPTKANAPAGSPYLYYAAASSAYAAFAFPADTSAITSFTTALLPTVGGAGETGFPTAFATPYVYHYSLDGQYVLNSTWVAVLGYEGSTGRRLPIETNLMNALAPEEIAGEIPVNPLINGVAWSYPEGVSKFNALLAELKHQMAHGFDLDAQYRVGKSLDNGSQSNANIDYEFLPGYNYGASAFDARQMFKVFGVWSPTISKGQSNWMVREFGDGWNLSGIMNLHSGFPYTPEYNGIAGNAVYQGSSGNGGNSNLRPTSYAGGAATSQSTNNFKSGNGNFTNYQKGCSGGMCTGAPYFTQPNVPSGAPAIAPGVTSYTFAGIPDAPGIARNSFYGPRYFDIDMSASKDFGLPSMKVLGEGAHFEVRANAYNLFNKLNLNNSGLDTNITDTTFGMVNGSNGVMAGRTVEGEFHFKF